MEKVRVYRNSGEVLGVQINELGILTADLLVVLVFLTAGLILKDPTYRVPMWVGGALYLIFAVLWHTL